MVTLSGIRIWNSVIATLNQLTKPRCPTSQCTHTLPARYQHKFGRNIQVCLHSWAGRLPVTSCVTYCKTGWKRTVAWMGTVLVNSLLHVLRYHCCWYNNVFCLLLFMMYLPYSPPSLHVTYTKSPSLVIHFTPSGSSYLQCTSPSRFNSYTGIKIVFGIYHVMISYDCVFKTI